MESRDVQTVNADRYAQHPVKAPLNGVDLSIVMRAPADAGAAGVVIWVDEELTAQPHALVAYVRDQTAPRAVAIVAEAEECARRVCAGHGRCVPLGSQVCVCDVGHTGAHCNATIAHSKIPRSKPTVLAHG